MPEQLDEPVCGPLTYKDVAALVGTVQSDLSTMKTWVRNPHGRNRRATEDAIRHLEGILSKLFSCLPPEAVAVLSEPPKGVRYP